MGIAADFVLIVLAGLCGGILARLLRLPLLVGYVAAGVFVGPHTAGPAVGQVRDIELLAEIGVALLLFSLGLEISLRDLGPVRRIALLGGPLQIVLTAAAAAAAATGLLRMPAAEAVWFGAMVSLSSTMVVLKTLSATGMTSTLASRVMIGLLIVQDLAVIPMLIILPQLGRLEGVLPAVLRASAIGAVFLLAVILAGTRVLPGLLRRVLVWGSRELFLVAVVAAGVGFGFAAHALGLSFALGAFVAGLILSESEFSHQALSDVIPLRDIFGLLFFVTVGMLFDPSYVRDHLGVVLLTVGAVFAGKALITGGLARIFGYGNLAPWVIGFGLSQIGEFSFVLARQGRAGGFLQKDTYDLVLTCTVLTMALSLLVAAAALPVGRAWRKWTRASLTLRTVNLPESGPRNHVVVAGYGRTGRAVMQVLGASGIPAVVVEANHEVFGDAAAAGLAAVWGDISREEIQHAAGLERARMLVLTLPDRLSVELGLDAARRLNPGIDVVARAAGEEQVAELRRRGVASVVQPEFEGGVEMVRQALLRFEHDPRETQKLIREVRNQLYGAMAPAAPAEPC
jgi:CPA2 family monovalent cation:H+ antiporter-2